MTDRSNHSSSTRVVVLGGGYAGATAANHLPLRADVEVTLVNARPRFVERIRLHQLVAGTAAATVDYGTLLGDGVRLVVDRAHRIDTATRHVELSSAALLPYDYVIYAVGSTAPCPRRSRGRPSTPTRSPSSSPRRGSGPPSTSWTSTRRSRSSAVD